MHGVVRRTKARNASFALRERCDGPRGIQMHNNRRILQIHPFR